VREAREMQTRASRGSAAEVQGRLDLLRELSFDSRLGLARRDDEESSRSRVREDLGEEARAVGVPPLNVVDDHDDGSDSQEEREEALQGRERAPAFHHGIGGEVSFDRFGAKFTKRRK